MVSEIALLKAKIKLKKTREGIFFTLNERDLELYFGKKKKRLEDKKQNG